MRNGFAAFEEIRTWQTRGKNKKMKENKRYMSMCCMKQ